MVNVSTIKPTKVFFYYITSHVFFSLKMKKDEKNAKDM